MVFEALQPRFRRISRYTAKKECMIYYKQEKEKLIKDLEKVSKLGLTTDCWWSEGQKIGYMAVTAHFIDQQWQLHNRILSFVHVPPPHSGEVLASEMLKVMDQWHIRDRVSSITVDNASSNDRCLQRLKADYSGRLNLPLDGKLFHVRCCAHILNLLVQEGLKVIDLALMSVRNGVRHILSSEARCIEFNKLVKYFGLEGRRLVLDVKTRWNSTFLMLSTVLYYKEPYIRYGEDNIGFLENVPTEREWENMVSICNFLGVFESVTKLISGRAYPTANLFLSELYKINAELNKFEDVEDQGSQEGQNTVLKKAVIGMRAKYMKYWNESNLLFSIGAVLDPR